MSMLLQSLYREEVACKVRADWRVERPQSATVSGLTISRTEAISRVEVTSRAEITSRAEVIGQRWLIEGRNVSSQIDQCSTFLAFKRFGLSYSVIGASIAKQWMRVLCGVVVVVVLTLLDSLWGMYYVVPL